MPNYKAGKLSVKDIKYLLLSSYDNKLNDVLPWIIDKSLSTNETQVYTNNSTPQVIVVHRGTKGMKDIITDTKLLFGFKNNNRFNDARKIQQQAENKYGSKNISTIGHSLGAAIAEDIGRNSKEIITLNKPTLPLDILLKKKVGFNQYDIRTKKDPISILKPLQQDNKDVIIDSTSNNPLTEHSVNILNRLPENEMIGAGQIKKLKLKELKTYLKQLKKNKKINFNITGKNKKQLQELLKNV
jgi:hypothetical protein